MWMLVFIQRDVVVSGQREPSASIGWFYNQARGSRQGSFSIIRGKEPDECDPKISFWAERPAHLLADGTRQGSLNARPNGAAKPIQ